jgi:hypothetical protein
MTTHSGRRWFLRGSVLAVVGLTCASPIWFLGRRQRAFRRFLKEGDHQALLAACRDLIKRRQEFRPDGQPGGSDEVVSVNPTDPRLAAVIRELEPTDVSVSASRVRIELHGGHDHFGFYAFAEGAEMPSDGGLIPGLYPYGTN